MSLFSLAGVVLGTVSWFVANNQTPKELNIKGQSAGAYFAYGDGLPYEEDGEGKIIHRPYGISVPRHLYNLSWLQYMGQFDDGQYYFEIADNVSDEGLDMNGYVLPPIGTEEKPFVGNFNGKGKIIKNLTVTNDEDELFNSQKHPDQTQVTYEAPEIVGLFGVVGNYNDAYEGTYESSTNSIYDLGISNISVQTTTNKALVGIAAGYVDATISNVAVNESTINVETASTAAVDTVNLTSNLSDYGVVGYATDDYKKSITKLEENLYDIAFADPANAEFNAVDDGDSQGWGGSINMKTIYNRIVSLRRTKSTDVSNHGNSTANWKIERTFYDNVESDETTYYNTVSTSNGYNDAYSRYLGSNESGHNYIGNYNIYARAASNGYGADGTTYGDQQYLYLCGGHYESNTYNTYYEHTGYLITDGNGNYLTYDDGSLSNTTNSEQASVWNFTVYSGSQYYISTSYEGSTVYLYYNNGVLGTIGSTGSTRRWTVTQNGNNLTIVYNTSKIFFYNDSWTLIPTADQEVVDYYTIGNGTYYISNTVATGRNNASATTNVGTAAHFYVEDSTNYVYMLSGSTKYYLTYYRYSSGGWGGSTNYINFNTDPSASNYYPFTYNGTYLRASRNSGWGGTTYYYPRYNNGWVISDSTNYDILPSPVSKTESFSTFYLYNSLKDSEVTRTGPDYHQTSEDVNKTNSESRMHYTAEDTTYLPLNVGQDLDSYISNTNTMNTQISSGNLDPKDSNTGYIISGSNIPANATTFSGPNYSDIRISRYAISNVSESYSKSSGSTTTISDLPNSSIYTINTSGSETTMSSELTSNANFYTRFSDSKTSFFQNSLATNNNDTYTTNAYVYGLHFMDSTISMQSLVNASKVSVLGNKCDTYQFPVDCIDFNLKQKGVINFFAGTYFSKNDSFFSLHEIIRNNDAVVKGDPENKEYTSYNTISDIKEIEEVYSNDVGEKTTKYANIYKYKDKTGNAMYSVPYRIDGNQNKFAMDKNSTTDLTTPYEYATMGQSDFNAYCSTYGYTLKFKTSQIGKQNSAFTTNRIYYFEFPMNPGEYCLGSVTGGTGAYLLYLDIGANAAKTQRTTVYEHYTEIQKLFEYPAGVAVVAVSTVADNLANSRALDETNTANFLILAGTNGTITITRSANDVEVARTGGFTTNAKPTLVGDLMWDNSHQQYNIHKPSSEGSANISSEITSEDTVTEVRVLNYYDWNVNLEELTITRIIDTSTDDGTTWTRTFYQEYQDGTNTTELSEMKIYHTENGTKYSEEDLSNPSTSEVKTYAGASASSVSTTLICKITYIEDNGEEVTQEWKIQLDLAEGDSGHYYIIPTSGALYNLVATVNEGSVTLTVVSTGGRTIVINGTTVTQGSTVTLTPAP